jgi:hypothetical protein
MDDRRKRQTSTATPAEPGDLPWGLEIEVVLEEAGGESFHIVETLPAVRGASGRSAR